MQLASPALPVGGFSYSEGLEAAVEAGLVRDEAQAGDWLLDQLRLSLARADLPVLAQAVPAWQAHDLARIRRAERLGAAHARERRAAPADAADGPLAGRMAEEPRRRPTTRMAQLAALRPAPTWPVAFALAAALDRRAAARRAAGLRLRLGREHGAGGDAQRAAGPERRAAHPGAADRRAARRGASTPPRWPTSSARPSRRCWPS